MIANISFEKGGINTRPAHVGVPTDGAAARF
jgi:hypothetical protein